MAARSCEEEIACIKMCSAVTDEGLSAPEVIHCCIYARVNQMAPVTIKERTKDAFILFYLFFFWCRACDM